MTIGNVEEEEEEYEEKDDEDDEGEEEDFACMKWKAPIGSVSNCSIDVLWTAGKDEGDELKGIKGSVRFEDDDDANGDGDVEGSGQDARVPDV